MSLKQARALAKWSYAQAKTECEARVVRWEHSTFTRHSLEPHWFERHRFRPGDLCKPGAKAYATGFDAEGSICVVRQPTGLRGRIYETFYAPRDGGIGRRHFDHSPEKHVINDAFFEIERGRVVRIDTVYARAKPSAETFRWDSRGRLARSDRKDASGKSAYEMVWDRHGLARVEWIAGGKRVVSWRRVEKKTSLAANRAKIEAGLVRTIRKALDEEPEPIRAVALWWCGAEWQHRLPPNVAVTSDAKFDWSPPEWDGDRHVRFDRKLWRLCEDASSDVWQSDLQDEADDVLRSVAKKLRTKSRVSYAVEVDARESAASQAKKQLR